MFSIQPSILILTIFPFSNVVADLIPILDNKNIVTCHVSDIDIKGKYEGSCLDGKAQGHGTSYGKDTYIGSFKEGKKHGNGKYIWANGNIYEGNWVDGKKNGKGSYIWPNGNSYTGEWLNNQFNGEGKYTWINGDIYEGEWVNGKANGKGKFSWAKGDVYIGDWVEDIRHGNGTYIWGNYNKNCGLTLCKKKFVGEYKAGKKYYGKATYFNTVDYYVGKFNDKGKRIGKTRIEIKSQ